MKKITILIGVLFFIIYITYVMGANYISNADDSLSSNIENTTKSGFKIVIDPGHGGQDPGAKGTSGQYEKDFTLQLARKVKELAEKETQLQIYLTRTDDRTISSMDRERPKFANQLDADLFISIHGNTYTDPSVFGTETFYYREESLTFATIMHKNLVNATGSKDRGVKKEDFFVVKDTEMPAVLLEVGYLTNPNEELKMWKDDYQYRVASSIIEGIKEYLNVSVGHD